MLGCQGDMPHTFSETVLCQRCFPRYLLLCHSPRQPKRFSPFTPRISSGTIPVFKKNSRTNKNNYRPISILRNISKILLCIQISICMHTNINANICINKSLRILRKGFLVNINLDLEEVVHSFQYGNQGSEFDLGSRYLQYFQI